ncbi:polyprenyl synthetase family protein [Candidatus Woesearchaeota archaeon]|nr:polyprenyl synthetase family protein [Candidatus Woesearchaeota archaeon]
MDNYSAKMLPFINRQVEEFFPRRIDDAWIHRISVPLYSFDPKVLSAACSVPFYNLYDRGGKRIRPVLTCLIHQALGGDRKDICRFAIISEMIHSGTLIVDDIEDNSDFRRGKETLHNIYGTSIAINAGNLQYFLPQIIISESDLPDSKKVLLYALIVEEMTKVHLGQAMDIQWSHDHRFDVPMDDYLQMSAYKTGALLSVAMRVGAILSDADKKTADALGTIAESVGIAFQIWDDILNLKPSKEWGKEYGEDITEGKLTYMVIDTISKADDLDKEKLIQILSAQTQNIAEIDEAIGIMESHGSFERASDFAHSLISDASAELEKILPPSEHKDILQKFLRKLIDRKV